MLATERADKLILLELVSIAVNESGPLVHLMAGLLIKLVLVIVVLLFQLLRHLPYDIVLELQQSPLLLVMIHQDPTLCELSGKVIGHDINLHLKLLSRGVFYVLIDLSVLVEEAYDVRASLRQGLAWRASRRYVLHRHQYLINSGDVLLHLGDVVL